MTPDQIYTDVQNLLLKYHCYCNSPDNCQQVAEDLGNYFETLVSADTIDDWKVEVSKRFNGGDWGVHPQSITGLVMFDKDNHEQHFMFNIGTRQTTIYPQWVPKHVKGRPNKTPKPTNPKSDYDRAMGILQ